MNVLITGTPGTGKTTTAKRIAEKVEINHLDISEMVKSEKLYESYDQDFDSYLIDEDKLLKRLKPLIRKGNLLIDTHQCSMFPSKWFDLVVVLTIDNQSLYDRLKSRNYSDLKIEENIDCEIMGVISEEALETFGRKKTLILNNGTPEEMHKNISRILQKMEMSSGE